MNRVVILLLILAGVATVVPTPVRAIPRYSAKYGQTCSLCHTNPTGAGLRTLYATQYIVPTELSMTTFEPEELEKIRPDLSGSVTVGLDLRTLLYQGGQDRSGIIAMQGDIYAAVQMNEKFLGYVDVGRGGAQEYFGVAYLLPGNGYFKAGRFMPDYGWRWADHQMFSRRFLLDEDGNDYPSALHDDGVEIGAHYGALRATASLLDGSGENGESYAARAVVRFNPGVFNLALGTSILRREELSGHQRAAGVFGYAAVGPMTWVVELDETRNSSRTGVLVSNELGWEVVQGFTLRATYSFQDPDVDLKTGTRSRYGAGFDALATPFFGVLLMANQYDFRQGDLIDASDYFQGELVLHFLY